MNAPRRRQRPRAEGLGVPSGSLRRCVPEPDGLPPGAGGGGGGAARRGGGEEGTRGAPSPAALTVRKKRGKSAWGGARFVG